MLKALAYASKSRGLIKQLLRLRHLNPRVICDNKNRDRPISPISPTLLTQYVYTYGNFGNARNWPNADSLDLPSRAFGYVESGTSEIVEKFVDYEVRCVPLVPLLPRGLWKFWVEF